MEITDNAKEIFQEAMDRLHKDACRIELVRHHCGGFQLGMELICKEEAKRLIDINGLSIDLSEEDEATLKGYAFDAQGKNLRLIAPNTHCGGCCHGDGQCNGDCDGDGECCDNCKKA